MAVAAGEPMNLQLLQGNSDYNRLKYNRKNIHDFRKWTKTRKQKRFGQIWEYLQLRCFYLRDSCSCNYQIRREDLSAIATPKTVNKFIYSLRTLLCSLKTVFPMSNSSSVLHAS